MEACHSGSFVDEIKALGNTIVSTACATDESSYRAHGHSYWARCIANLVPELTADQMKPECRDYVNAALGADWPDRPESETQTPQCESSETVQHKDQIIAWCCVPPSAIHSSWGAVKSLYR